jgi:large subunit ribosomal protein L10
LADISELDAADTSDLRRKCFNSEVKLIVVKNTLLKKALEKAEGEFDELYPILKDSTSVMFCNTGNSPAKLIKDFRKKHDKPLLKGAFVEESVYIGDNQLEALVAIKSKEELIGDLVALLQSPMKNVISALQSGGNTIHGVLETLSKREE